MTEPAKPRNWFLAPLASLLLLGGVVAETRLFHMPPGDLRPYHEAVRAAVEAIPAHIGEWDALDSDVPPSALTLLKPNVLISRQYSRAGSRQDAQLLFVHCADASDLSGHYPPVCYRASGWEQRSAEPRDWKVGDVVVPGTEYVFGSERISRSASMVVLNFLLVPGREVLRDMDGVRRVSADRRRKLLGAAQVQLVFGGGMDQAERDRAFEVIVGACMPAIRLIRGGVDE